MTKLMDSELVMVMVIVMVIVMVMGLGLGLEKEWVLRMAILLLIEWVEVLAIEWEKE